MTDRGGFSFRDSSITFAFVIWVYVRRNYAYTLLRNTLFATFMLAVPGYILYPTAPPRMLTDMGGYASSTGPRCNHTDLPASKSVATAV